MTQLTTFNGLERHITLLRKVEASVALFASCYLNHEEGAADARAALTERAALLRYNLKGNDLAELGRALREIDSYLTDRILPRTKGLAIFVRSPPEAFLLPIQVEIPVSSCIAICPTPTRA